MTIQRIATLFGVVFLAVGALGFVASGAGHSMTSMDGTSMLLGVFPVNVVHNAVHAGFGVWGLVAGRSRGSAIVYTLASGAAYLVLAIVGLSTPTLFGLVPIGGYDIMLHLVLAVVLAGAGFWTAWIAPPRTAAESGAKRAA
jgi:Domain of unknown function (DUF4383)